jgi:RNA polymerase sigma-70 factor (ECF subfamily)
VKAPLLKETGEYLPTRESLLGRLKDLGDDQSWRDFFLTYWKFIYGVAIRAGLDDAGAQEVVQETVISVARHMPDFNYDSAHGSFKAWLLNLTHWRINDQFRKRQAEQKALSPAPSNHSGTSFMDSIADPAGSETEAF